MNTAFFSACIFLFSLCATSMADSSKSEMEFLNGLPDEEVAQFMSIYLDQSLAKGDRYTQMNNWARKQGRTLQLKFGEHFKKVKKDDRALIMEKSRALYKDFSKQVQAIFNNPKLSHSAVCKEINTLSAKIADQMRAMGENGPKSHTPCNGVKNQQE